MSFTKELGNNLHMINSVLDHDKLTVDKHVTNILDHLDHSGSIPEVVPNVPDKVVPELRTKPDVLPGYTLIHDTIPHTQQIQPEVIQPSTQLVALPKKKVSFQSEVRVVEPPQTHTPVRSNEAISHIGNNTGSHIQDIQSQGTNAGQNLTNINNIVGFKMSISTLYFVGLLIIIGAVAYFQQKRK